MDAFRYTISIFLAASSLTLSAQVKQVAQNSPPTFFTIADGTILTFQGTYEFKLKRLAFAKKDDHYIITQSGDQSTSLSRLVVTDSLVVNVLQSGEHWFTFRLPFIKGRRWAAQLRGDTLHYEVLDNNTEVQTPAGRFKHCARIRISWIANALDAHGPQKRLIFLAPGLGIIKQMVFENGHLSHEETLTTIRTQ